MSSSRRPSNQVDASNWGPNDVCQWASSILQYHFPDANHSILVERVLSNLITGFVLVSLDQSDWRELIPLIGPRKVLMQAAYSVGIKPSSFRGLSSLPQSPRRESRTKRMSTTGGKKLPTPSQIRNASIAPIIPPPQTSQSPQSTPIRTPSPTPTQKDTMLFPLIPNLPTFTVTPPTALSNNPTVNNITSGNNSNNSINNSINNSMNSPPKDLIAPVSSPSLSAIPANNRTMETLMSERKLDSTYQSDLFFMPTTPANNKKKESKSRGWFKLLKRSQFSNLPIIDYNYPYTEHGWQSRLWWQITSPFLRLFFMLKIFALTLRWTDFILVPFFVMLTYFLVDKQWVSDINPSLLLNIVIFPLSFAVHAAYQRRENSLQYLSQLKACTLNIYWQHRSWCADSGVPKDFLACTNTLISSIFEKVHLYVSSPDETTKVGALQEVYRIFGELFLVIDVLRLCGFNPSLLTRTIHDLRESFHSFERLRVYSDYRTPSSMRVFIYLALILTMICLCPYFALIATKYGKIAGYFPCAALGLLLCCLTNVQQMLENPFVSATGIPDPDDIRLDSCLKMVDENDMEEIQAVVANSVDSDGEPEVKNDSLLSARRSSLDPCSLGRQMTFKVKFKGPPDWNEDFLTANPMGRFQNPGSGKRVQIMDDFIIAAPMLNDDYPNITIRIPE